MLEKNARVPRERDETRRFQAGVLENDRTATVLVW